jgi:hypothetical protein
MEINNNPPNRWLRRLKPSHIIWLVKEKLWASVSAPWIPPEPGHITGTLTIRRVIDNYLQSPESWYCNADGQGINGSLLFLPAEGHLEDDEVPISDLHKIYERLEKLEGWMMAISLEQAQTRLWGE